MNSKRLGGFSNLTNKSMSLLEVIGEATKSIPKSFRDRYPFIPWRKMAGMRDKMIHKYFGVDVRILWETIKRDIPPLKPLIWSVLESLG